MEQRCIEKLHDLVATSPEDLKKGRKFELKQHKLDELKTSMLTS
jgi:hypothetical protein